MARSLASCFANHPASRIRFAHRFAWSVSAGDILRSTPRLARAALLVAMLIVVLPASRLPAQQSEQEQQQQEPQQKTAEGSESQADATQLAEWIKQLDADRFSQRKRASQKLYDAGKAAVPALLETARGGAKEAAQRSVDILKRFLQSPDESTQAEARAALEKLAADGSSPVAKAAEQALRPKPENNTPAPPIQAPPLPRIQIGAIQKQIQIGGGAGGIGGTSKRVSVVNGVKTIEVSEKGRKIKIIDDPAKGIEMEVTETKDGKQETQKYEAKDADELKKKHPDAHRLFEQHTQEGILPEIPFPPGGILPAPNGLPIDPQKMLDQLQQRGQRAEAIEKASKQLQDAIERLQKAQDNPTKDDVSKALEQLQEARRALEAAR